MSAVTTSDRANRLCWEYASENPVERIPSYATNMDMALLVALSLLPPEKHSMFLECLAYDLKRDTIAQGIAQEIAA